eukprot:jgi/Tetstr1/458202/TSEL_044691.t1
MPFDKMHTYNAGIEAARPEARADREWPELDGHHGIQVVNVPLGSPGYVHSYMRGKAHAAAMREAWGRLKAATAGHISDADTCVMEREAEPASGSHELISYLDQANSSRLQNEEAGVPPGGGPREGSAEESPFRNFRARRSLVAPAHPAEL